MAKVGQLTSRQSTPGTPATPELLLGNKEKFYDVKAEENLKPAYTEKELLLINKAKSIGLITLVSWMPYL